MTGREIISASLRLIGAIAPGEAPPASEAVDGLAAINRMLGTWSNDNVLINAKVEDVFTLVPNTQSYTYGTSGTFNSARPVEIIGASIRIGSTDYPVTIIGVDEWLAISQKETQGIPEKLYAEGTYPLETINLYPNPSAANSLVLFTLKPLTEIATLDTAVSVPPGYEEAIIYNGAIRLAPEYGRTVSQEVALIAESALEAIKKRNYKPGLLLIDNAVMSNGQFNFNTGDYN